MLWSYLYTARVSLTDAAMCMNLIRVFVEHSDVRYFLVIVIFYCANTTAFHMSDWKMSEGDRYVKLSCKMGCCLKKS